ncbi:MAG: TAXI family TRAP transporter solute-binding subunit [Alphaproteobacteria bacterium]
MIDRTRRGCLAALAAGVMATSLTLPANAQDDASYILATATTGGTYYPVGVAIATLVKIKLEAAQHFTLSAISSAGSAENIALMRDGNVQFSILQGLYGAWAADGSGALAADGPQANLRSVSMLWQNVEHFVLLSHMAPTGTIDDLGQIGDEPFAIGAKNSGTEGSGLTILGNLGFDIEAMNLVDAGGYSSTADALQNGNVVGMNVPAGVPVSAMTRVAAAMGDTIRVLDFTDEQMARANGSFDGLWTRYVIPADTYPGQTAEIATVAQPNFLAVNADVSEEHVYLITKAMYENLDFLNNIHAATTVMALDKAIDGLPLPLHPGAIRYYEEVGLTIPDRLRPAN